MEVSWSSQADAYLDLELIHAAGIEGLEPAFELLEGARLPRMGKYTMVERNVLFIKEIHDKWREPCHVSLISLDFC